MVWIKATIGANAGTSILNPTGLWSYLILARDPIRVTLRVRKFVCDDFTVRARVRIRVRVRKL